MSQCLHFGRSSIPTPGAPSDAIPLGMGFTVHYLVLLVGLEIGDCVHVKSHLAFQKRLDRLMGDMNDIAPTHKKRKLVKNQQNVLQYGHSCLWL